jgi:hypothetical protein
MNGISKDHLLFQLRYARENGDFEVHGISFSQQKPTGSTWGKLVTNGIVESNAIVWAYIPRDRSKSGANVWIGILLDSGRGKEVFIDLREEDGKKRLNVLENKCKNLLKKTVGK